MKIVSLYNAHDGGYAILENGEIVEHTEFERYTRLKESGGDSLALYLKNHTLDEADHFVSVCPDTNLVKTAYGECNTHDTIPKNKVSFYSHHLCHAAHAYFSSPYDDAIVISIDNAGMEVEGRGISCGIYFAQGMDIKKVWDIPSEQFSLGDLWGRLTRWVFKLSSGYPRGHQAGSVMAMAALGDPQKYYKDLRSMIEENHKAAVTAPPGAKRGVYVPPEEEVFHPFLNKYREIAEDEQEKFNLAASLQKVTEELLFDIVQRAITMARNQGFASMNICFSGGVSLNSVSMGKIWQHLHPQGWNMYIPPVPYDGGLNIGAAQYHYHSILRYPKFYHGKNTASPYLGEVWNIDEIYKVLKEYDNKVSIVKNVELDQVAQLLADGNIISVYNGRSESGRRALGNRSILANPAIPDMKEIINDRVKHRQWYRPFAPSILEEYGNEWFEAFFPSPYMSFVFLLQKDKLGKAKAIEHFDGTARVQSVSREQNEWYYDLISKFNEKTGIPLVLNTSFNDREPIVETPYHAMECFMGTDIDYLYFAETKDLVSKN